MKRCGFTLVELLISISIIAILLAMAGGTYSLTMESARSEKTKATIRRLGDALTNRWGEYRTRRVSIDPAVWCISNMSKYSSLNAGNPADKAKVATSDLAHARLLALRELMRMEMPDRYEDLVFSPTAASSPSLRAAYLRKIDAARQKYNSQNGTSHATAAAFVQNVLGNGSNPNESAECLWLIVTVALEPDERVSMHAEDSADTSNPPNFMPEILDGWGHPIHFLRWAPGFASDMQDQNPVASHDPFDYRLLFHSPTNSNPPPLASGESVPVAWGFMLVPLVYSAGPDGEPGLYQHLSATPTSGTLAIKNNHPYSRYSTSTGYKWRGEPEPDPVSGETYHLDNIHNHTINVR